MIVYVVYYNFGYGEKQIDRVVATEEMAKKYAGKDDMGYTREYREYEVEGAER